MCFILIVEQETLLFIFSAFEQFVVKYSQNTSVQCEEYKLQFVIIPFMNSSEFPPNPESFTIHVDCDNDYSITALQPQEFHVIKVSGSWENGFVITIYGPITYFSTVYQAVIWRRIIGLFVTTLATLCT